MLDVPVSQENVASWAAGLDLPIGGETILFVDCEAAFYRTSVSRSTAQLLQMAGVEFGLMREQWCCGGPAAEMGYLDASRQLAEHNVADWRSATARSGSSRSTRTTTSASPRTTSTTSAPDYEFEIVHITELVAELIRDGKLTLTKPIERTVTYHDPCRLNKRKGIHASPREILRAIPGLTFKDVDHVTQWSYCSGAGAGLAIEKPEITAEISRRRVARAKDLDVDTLVSACVWSERPLSAAGAEAQIDVRDLMELVAESAGLDPRGVNGVAGPQQGVVA